MMLNSLVERTYIINLAERSDRRKEMEAALRRIGKSIGDDDVAVFPAIRPADRGAFPSVGARGCFLSHLGVLKEAEDSGRRTIAILEDDVEFADDFAERGARVFAKLVNVDWAVFYGGHRNLGLSGEGLFAIPPHTAVLTAHCICFRGAAIPAARRYLEAMLRRPAGDPAGGPMHVDGAYGWFRKDHPGFATYAAAPPLAEQRRSRSDIADLRWFDRTPGIRRVAQIARRMLRAR